jgi:hypothetical protein
MCFAVLCCEGEKGIDIFELFANVSRAVSRILPSGGPEVSNKK